MSGSELFMTCFEKIISFVLSELKVTLNFLAQIDIFSRSLLRRLVVSWVSPPDVSNVVSSANICGVDSRSTIMSLINRINKRGPRREPCGTPASTGRLSEIFPSTIRVL